MKASFVGLSALALGVVFAVPANAVPGSRIKATEVGSSVVQVGCHWRHGHRYCEPAVVINFGKRHSRWQHVTATIMITTAITMAMITTKITTSATERVMRGKPPLTLARHCFV